MTIVRQVQINMVYLTMKIPHIFQPENADSIFYLEKAAAIFELKICAFSV